LHGHVTMTTNVIRKTDSSKEGKGTWCWWNQVSATFGLSPLPFRPHWNTVYFFPVSDFCIFMQERKYFLLRMLHVFYFYQGWVFTQRSFLKQCMLFTFCIPRHEKWNLELSVLLGKLYLPSHIKRWASITFWIGADKYG
jgi:hypothetical protein